MRAEDVWPEQIDFTSPAVRERNSYLGRRALVLLYVAHFRSARNDDKVRATEKKGKRTRRAREERGGRREGRDGSSADEIRGVNIRGARVGAGPRADKDTGPAVQVRERSEKEREATSRHVYYSAPPARAREFYHGIELPADADAYRGPRPRERRDTDRKARANPASLV